MNTLSRVFASDFDYDLPPELIAQVPAPERDASRLLVLDRKTERTAHRSFADLLEYFQSGDVLVLNESRVLPARIRAVNPATGGKFEILLLEENGVNDWWAMLRPGKRARVGTIMQVPHSRDGRDPLGATVIAVNSEGHRRLRFSGTANIINALDSIGEIPLPPYIARPAGPSAAQDRERYQTVYSRTPGSVAAPTAGLHFTPALLERFRRKGVQLAFLRLHVGLGTFAPVKAERIDQHVMHEERYEVDTATAAQIHDAKLSGHRVCAVGTTSLRVLETLGSRLLETPRDHSGRTRIFIRPPHTFEVADALITNFHLPRSTLLMLVSAFAAPGHETGRETVLAAYSEAINMRYRFFSYGDAMLIL